MSPHPIIFISSILNHHHCTWSEWLILNYEQYRTYRALLVCPLLWLKYWIGRSLKSCSVGSSPTSSLSPAVVKFEGRPTDLKIKNGFRAFCRFWIQMLKLIVLACIGLLIWLPKKLYWIYSLLTIAALLFRLVLRSITIRHSSKKIAAARGISMH